MHSLGWGSGNVEINQYLIYVCHRLSLTIRSVSGRSPDQGEVSHMQEV